MDAINLTFNAPAASNYGSSIGYVVQVTGANEVTIATANNVVPLGIIVAAENQNGGQVTVCVLGRCKARAGAAITVGTHDFCEADGDGEVIPVQAGGYYVGRFVGKATAADNDLVDFFVQPGQINA